MSRPLPGSRRLPPAWNSLRRNLFPEIEVLVEVDSSNLYLRRYLDQGRPRAVRADSQTAARGRHGRRWYAPAGQGLYLSYLLFPNWPQTRFSLLNRISALAVVFTLVRCQPQLESQIAIKLPNDVLIGGCKVAGILTEMGSQEGRIQWAIVGIGVNLTHREFQLDRINRTPTSLALEGCQNIPTPDVFGRLLTDEFTQLWHWAESGQQKWLRAAFEEWTGVD